MVVWGYDGDGFWNPDCEDDGFIARGQILLDKLQR